MRPTMDSHSLTTASTSPPASPRDRTISKSGPILSSPRSNSAGTKNKEKDSKTKSNNIENSHHEEKEGKWLASQFVPKVVFDQETNWWTPIHWCPVSCLQFRGNVLVTGSVDKVVKVWDIENKTCPNTIFGHNGPVRCLKFDDNEIISGADDQKIKIWNLKTGKLQKTLSGHSERVCCLQFDEKLIISGSQDHTLRIWDRSGQFIQKLEGHTGSIWCLHFVGNRLATGSADETLKIWDIESLECINSLSGHKASIASLHITDSNVVVTASLDKSLRLWDLRSPSQPRILQDHAGPVGCVQADGDKIVSGSADEFIKIWDLKQGAVVSSLKQDSAVACLQFADSRLVVGTRKKLQMVDYRFQGEEQDAK